MQGYWTYVRIWSHKDHELSNNGAVPNQNGWEDGCFAEQMLISLLWEALHNLEITNFDYNLLRLDFVVAQIRRRLVLPS